MTLRIAALGVICSAGAFAGGSFVRTRSEKYPEICLAWQKRDFVYRVNVAGSQRTPGDLELAAIDAAFASWQTVAASCNEFRFLRGERTSETAIGFVEGGENENLIVFRERQCDGLVPADDPCRLEPRPHDACGNKYQCWLTDPKHSDLTYASTLTSYRPKSGLIVDADTEFNAAPRSTGEGWLFTTVSDPKCGEVASPGCVAVDLQNTQTHEIGHALGFDHALEPPESTMFFSAAPGDTNKRVIDHDTAEGFCSVYPRGLPATQCDPLGTSEAAQSISKRVVGFGAGSGCASSTGETASVLALGAALLTAGRPRRRA